MIKVKSISFPFSESNDINTKIKFDSFCAANSHLRNAKTRSWRRKLGDEPAGYFKTDFVVEYEDGGKYDGRYDIGSDESSLELHIKKFCETYGGIVKPYHFTDEQWEQFKKEYTKFADGYKDFLSKYSLTD